MKTTKSDKWQVTSDRMKGATRATRCPHVSRFTFHASAFTLIELLTVIAIMAALSALLLPVAGAVKKHQYIYNAQAEMAKLETAIDRYKAAYGFYPPGNHNVNQPNQALINQLYYELVGTTNNTAAPGNDPNYHPLDGRGLDLSGGTGGFVNQAFGVGGFMNCGKPNGGEDASVAKDFLSDLRPNQIANISNSVAVTVLITAVGGPDTTYLALGPGSSGLNPWRYVCPGTNNPGSYDLWVQLSIAGKKNLVCNWNKSVQVNSPLP